MCLLHIHAQSQSRILEVLPEEAENAELAVEDMASQVLLDLFDGGAVDEVTIRFASAAGMGLHYCSIHIHAQCSCQRCPLLPHTQEHMRLAIEKNMGSLLKELFGAVQVDSVTLSPAPLDYKSDPALSQSV
jgi:hypothetical protein